MYVSVYIRRTYEYGRPVFAYVLMYVRTNLPYSGIAGHSRSIHAETISLMVAPCIAAASLSRL